MISSNAFIQIGFFLLVLIALVKPVGWYMARVYSGQACGINWLIAPLEKSIYCICGIDPNQEMNWLRYTFATLYFSVLSLIVVYLIQRYQLALPLNPQHFAAVPRDVAFNTAASFVTNTNWQSYSGESTLSYFTQMLALTVQNFMSAAVGMSVLMALIRGITRTDTQHLGNFWVDTLRGILYIFLPLSLILAVVLASQGVIQNFQAQIDTQLVQINHINKSLVPDTINPEVASKLKQTNGSWVSVQSIPQGPVASQIAIKQLGTNGGGFFNANSAHPYENPNAITNFFELLAILLIPAALCYTYGLMVKQPRQGWIIFWAMLIIFIPLLWIAVTAEQNGNPLLSKMGVDSSIHAGYPGGNMEGKETRFGIVNSALWATATTVTSNGSVNSMHDSLTPLGGMIPLISMQLGEVIFGGVGCGLYSMLTLVFLTVFIAGLMVGRTPEYLSKKIETFEIKMVAFFTLLVPLLILVGTAFAAVTDYGISTLNNPGAHGLSEMLYAFSSMANNNGSAFAGLNANTPFWNIVGGIVMLLGRFGLVVPVLAIAGSLAKKKTVAVSAGTLPTHIPLFLFLLIGVVIIIGALTFFPALALGPIVEHLIMNQ